MSCIGLLFHASLIAKGALGFKRKKPALSRHGLGVVVMSSLQWPHRFPDHLRRGSLWRIMNGLEGAVSPWNAPIDQRCHAEPRNQLSEARSMEMTV